MYSILTSIYKYYKELHEYHKKQNRKDVAVKMKKRIKNIDKKIDKKIDKIYARYNMKARKYLY